MEIIDMLRRPEGKTLEFKRERLVERGLVREVGTGPNDPRRKCMIALNSSSAPFPRSGQVRYCTLR